MKNIFKVITDYPIAINSPDHIQPWGTMRDNSTSKEFIEEILNYFNNKSINFMDLGCSGGQLVIDFLKRNNNSIGLEGSDYSAKNKRANWKNYYNENLFTCDISKPFQVFLNDKPYNCDCISAWEVIEHLTKEGLEIMFDNIQRHLKPEGIFVGTISTKEDVINGFALHQTVLSKDEWYNFLKKYFDILNYDFKNAVRNDEGSFHILLKKKQNET